MVYKGSKSKFAKYIVPIIQNSIDATGATTYIEPFGGGGNIIDKISCERRVYADINEDLVALMKYAQSDPSLSIAPDECSFEHYCDVRADREHNKYSQEYRALIGYMASYGGRYFDGGYGRGSDGPCVYGRQLQNLRTQAHSLAGIEFVCCDYASLDAHSYNNCVFYIDPPYKNTKKYAKQAIDYDHLYDFCRELSKNNTVFVSEFEMPYDFECVWEKDRDILIRSDRSETGCKRATEKLFVHK